jgi:iron only hydrogenase large subunit-like protein
MACPGGCVAGAGTLLPVDLASKVVGRYQNEADAESPLESAYRDRGHELD